MSKRDSYDEISMLLSDLKSDIKDVLMDEVMNEVKEIELKHVEENVFSVYSPKIYKRRGRGGLDDSGNIVGEVHGMGLEIYNITPFNSGYGTFNKGTGLAELINDGNRLNGYFYDYPGEFERARPFLDNTIEEIEKTDSVENALVHGLRKRKYDIT